MGKARRWLKSLLSGRKPAYGSSEGKEKRRWGYVRSGRDPAATENLRGLHREDVVSDVYVTAGEEVFMKDGSTTHTIAVAATYATEAESALAAAQVSEVVGRLTSSGRGCMVAGRKRESKAAIRIQASFRGYLARRALRALKGLVRLQALVRGHIVRKQIAQNLRLMRALLRAQARARAHRVVCNESGLASRLKPAHATLGPSTPEKLEPTFRANKVKPDRAPSPVKRNAAKRNYPETEADRNNMDRSWLDRWIDGGSDASVRPNAIDDENAKIFEIDPGQPVLVSRRNGFLLRSSQSVFSISDRNCRSECLNVILGSPSKDATTAQLSNRSPLSVDMPTRKLEPASPMKSEYAQSLFGGYGSYRPSYMANTESWRAKARSQSAPKQRLEREKSGSARRVPDHVIAEPWSSRIRLQRSSLHTNSFPRLIGVLGGSTEIGCRLPVHCEAGPRH